MSPRANDDETATGPDDVDTSTQRPVLRVVRGDPSPEELAVLTAFAARGGDTGDTVDADQPARGRWNDPAASVTPWVRPGPGAWRASLR